MAIRFAGYCGTIHVDLPIIETKEVPEIIPEPKKEIVTEKKSEEKKVDEK